MPKYKIIIRKYTEVFGALDIEADDVETAIRRAEIQAQNIKFPDAEPAKYRAEGYTIS